MKNILNLISAGNFVTIRMDGAKYLGTVTKAANPAVPSLTGLIDRMIWHVFSADGGGTTLVEDMALDARLNEFFAQLQAEALVALVSERVQ